jgi:macrolide-specific efflux system membrane fusion protein
MPCGKLTSAPRSAELKTLHVNIGDKVKKDQLLGVIDPEQAQNQIKEVEATLMELRAQLNQARAESKLAQVTLARQQQLAQRQLVSRQDRYRGHRSGGETGADRHY